MYTQSTQSNFSWSLFLKKVGKVLFILYFVLGLLFIATRWYLIHNFDSLRQSITSELSEKLQIDLQAQQFKFDFYYFWPSIRLHDVQIARVHGPTSLKLPYVKAIFDWSSLWHAAPHFRALIIKDPSLTIRRIDNNNIDIAGFVFDIQTLRKAGKQLPVNNVQKNTESFKSIFFANLLAQTRLSLQHGRIFYMDERRPQSSIVAIENVQLEFQHNIFQWNGALRGAIRNQDKLEKFQFKAHIKESLFMDPEDPSTWNIALFANFDQTDIGNIAKRLYLNDYLHSGKGALRLWFQSSEGNPNSLITDVAAHKVKVRLQKDLPFLRVDGALGRLQFTLDKNKLFQIQAERLELWQNKHWHFGPMSVSSSYQKGNEIDPQHFQLKLSAIDLDTISKIGPSFPLHKEVRDLLKQWPLTGTVQNIQAECIGNFSNLNNWRFNGQFANLSMLAQANLPAVRNLSGSFSSSHQSDILSIAINAPGLRLSFPGIFARPTIRLNKAVAQIEVTLQPQLKIHIPSFRIMNPDAHLTGEASWTDTGGAGSIFLQGNILRAHGNKVVFYLPNVIGHSTLDWLKHAIKKGEVTRGNFIVRGPLQQFPWHDQKEGLFRIQADVNNAQIDLQPSQNQHPIWPLINDISAHLLFEGNRMLVQASQGNSLGIQARNVSVEIPSYFEPGVPLLVKGDISGDAEQIMQYLNQAHYIQNTIGSHFANSKAQGSIHALLTMKLPLAELENSHYRVQAKLQNVDFNYGLHLPSIHNLQGTLDVSRKGIFTPEKITGTLNQKPFSLDIQQKADDLKLNINGYVITPQIANFLQQDSLNKYIQGGTDLNVSVHINTKLHTLRVQGSTALIGISSTLPTPFQKANTTPWPMNFIWSDAPKLTSLTINAPDHFMGQWNFKPLQNTSQLRLQSGYLEIGTPYQIAHDADFITHIKVPELNVDLWSNILKQWGETQKNSSNITIMNLLPENTLIHTDIDVLTWNNHSIHNLQSTTRLFDNHNWHIRIKADEINGQLEYHPNPEQIIVKLNKLYLPDLLDSFSSSQDSLFSQTRALPTISMVIDDLRLGKRTPGKLELFTRNQNDIYHIDRLALSAPTGRWISSGYWQHNEHINQSQIKIDFQTSDLGQILRNLRIKEAINKTTGNLTATLNWQGPPHHPEVKTLSGNIECNLSNGQILPIEPGAGRLLNLLSMQHLLRRLTLDFSDVIQKGFAFDSYSGTYKIQNGVIQSDNTALISPSATIFLSGHVFLPEEKLKITAKVLPKFNAEAAGLALTIANPAIGISTLVGQWLLKDEISKFLSFEYDISGSFNEPIIRKKTKPL